MLKFRVLASETVFYEFVVEADQPISRKEAARLRAEFNERVRIAYEAN